MVDTLEETLKSDGASVVASVIDVAVAGEPVASISQQILKHWTGVRDKFFAKKVISLLENLDGADSVLLSQTIENLRLEHGKDYFDQVLFNSVEASNSSELSRLLGVALCKCACGDISKSSFWSISNALKSLTIQDISAIGDCEVGHVSQFTIEIIQRLQSVGLAQYKVFDGGGRVEWNVPLLCDFYKVVTDKSVVPNIARAPHSSGDKFPSSAEQAQRLKKRESRKLI